MNYFIIFLMAIVAVFAQIYINSVPLNAPPIRSDGQGYYMYLPAYFIYHDPKMLFLDQVQDVGAFRSTYFLSATGAMVDKYTMGTALLQLPFFLIAHILTSIVNPSAATGFTEYYQFANGISAAFYFFVGSCFAYKTTSKYVPKKFAVLALMVCTFGSNLFHYATYDASFSHIYSFAMISIFLYWIHLENDYKSDSRSRKALFYLLGGAIYGIIVLIRVTDATVILLYLLFSVINKKELKRRVIRLTSPSKVLFFGAGAVAAFLPQMLHWRVTTGHFLLNSYGETDPGFIYWKTPKILHVLFLPERGIFFWCPVLLIGLILGIIWVKRIDNVILCSVVFIALYIYVIASWHSYTLAGGYSHRIFVNIMALFILFTGNGLYGLSKVKDAIKLPIDFLIRVAVIWNTICMYAYWRYVIGFGGFQLAHAVKILKWYLHME